MARLCKPYLGSIIHPNPYTRIVEYTAHDQMAVFDLSSIAVNIFVKPVNLAPEDWEDDRTLPHGWKPIRKIPNVKTKPVECSLCDQEKHGDERDTTNSDEENYTEVETSRGTVENSEYEITLRLAVGEIL